MTQVGSSNTNGFLWVEEGESRESVMADVALVGPVHRSYTFAVPDDLAPSLAIGQRVNVPIGKRGRLTQGFVLSLDRRKWEGTLRSIDSVVDDASFITPDLVTLARQIASHYACPLGRTLKAMTPESVRQRRGLKTVRYVALCRTPEEIEQAGRRLSTKRRALVDTLAEADEPLPVHDVLQRLGVSPAILRAVVKEGWAQVTARKECVVESEEPIPLVEPGFELNQEQRDALGSVERSIDAACFSVTLLFGVSGSGKTEIYLRAMRRIIEAGRQAILLVPEIVLTTQLVGRVASRLERVAVNHSGLTDAHRSIIWRQIASGDKQVIVGTRSAVFAPCADLGLICVDEEQETSYKNLQAPRFHVRDVAIMRAKQLGIPVVLGSATPSLESWQRSHTHPSWKRVTLARRVKSLPLPKIHLVDMGAEVAEQKRQVLLSRVMERMLSETLDQKEQALILINRRGYAIRLMCSLCRSRVACPNCNVAMIVHVPSGDTLCHYCRHRMPTPTVCPTLGCGGSLQQLGVGTQRAEKILRELFPRAHMRRVDGDTMKHRRDYQQIVDDFEARRIDVLIGTQMIAKGLDFPFVSFVGVLDADPVGLATDFRAEERLFQLITQVAGRAGRAGTSGRVVVQTTLPDLPSLKHALEHDYESFARGELALREQVGLPPFRRLARIVLSDAREQRARDEADSLTERIQSAIVKLAMDHADVLGPNPAALARLRGRYRYELILRTLGAADLHRLLDQLLGTNAMKTRAESIVIDVDPVSLS